MPWLSNFTNIQCRCHCDGIKSYTITHFYVKKNIHGDTVAVASLEMILTCEKVCDCVEISDTVTVASLEMALACEKVRDYLEISLHPSR